MGGIHFVKLFLCKVFKLEKHNHILAIESSCDDTSAAIIKDGAVLSNLTFNQSIHKHLGGVVPELASRAHMEKIYTIVDLAIKEAGISKDDIDAIAFTRGPGLLGSLIVGVNFAKGFSLAKNIPMIEVNHMKAHVLAHWSEDPKPDFPFLCLTVSGGHTQIVLVSDYDQFKIIGETKDDAAGEAFDKSGKLLGLDYPAGPVIDKLAQEGEAIYQFPKSKMQNFDYSFSGLKTSIMYFLRRELKNDDQFIADNLANICASIQQTIVDYLLDIFFRAANQLGVKNLGIAGGVSANSELRMKFQKMCKENGYIPHIPAFQYCTDNAAMIGITAYYQFLKNDFVDHSVYPMARMPLK